MKQIHFFAVKEDILSVLEAVEKIGPLKYIRMGQISTNEYNCFTHGIEIPNLGIANTDSVASSQSFLITIDNIPINLRPIKVIGSELYVIDQLLNPDTITFTPGGVWDNDIILNGRIATASNSSLAKELMKRFDVIFKKHFKKVKAFSVGPYAFDFLKAGKRLTASAQSPREYDLTIF